MSHKFESGNQAAKKDIKAEAFLQVRCLTADKNAWVKAAQAQNKTLSEFAIQSLNDAANSILT